MALAEGENALLFTIWQRTKMMAILEGAQQGLHTHRRDEPENLGWMSE
jgi:hypothetical protein